MADRQALLEWQAASRPESWCNAGNMAVCIYVIQQCIYILVMCDIWEVDMRHAHAPAPPSCSSIFSGLPSSSLSAVRRFSITSSCPGRMDDAPVTGMRLQGCGITGTTLLVHSPMQQLPAVLTSALNMSGCSCQWAHPGRGL